MRIATRGSDLALWQARWVQRALQAAGVERVELHVVATTGDVNPEGSLARLEGTGFFSREVEAALIEGAADVAVHSFKDLPTQQPPALVVAAVPTRGVVNDLLILRSDVVSTGDARPLRAMPASTGDAPVYGRCPADSGGRTASDDRTASGGRIWPLAPAARVGTSSARRAAQLLHIHSAGGRRPDLIVADIRGNVPTRIGKLRQGQYDAVVLAAAGIARLSLDLTGLVVVDLQPYGFLPAPAQGALALQCRRDDEPTRALRVE